MIKALAVTKTQLYPQNQTITSSQKKQAENPCMHINKTSNVNFKSAENIGSELLKCIIALVSAGGGCVAECLHSEDIINANAATTIFGGGWLIALGIVGREIYKMIKNSHPS